MTVQCVRAREPTTLIPVPSAHRVIQMCVQNAFMDVDISAVSCEIDDDKNHRTITNVDVGTSSSCFGDFFHVLVEH